MCTIEENASILPHKMCTLDICFKHPIYRNPKTNTGEK